MVACVLAALLALAPKPHDKTQNHLGPFVIAGDDGKPIGKIHNDHASTTLPAFTDLLPIAIHTLSSGTQHNCALLRCMVLLPDTEHAAVH